MLFVTSHVAGCCTAICPSYRQHTILSDVAPQPAQLVGKMASSSGGRPVFSFFAIITISQSSSEKIGKNVQNSIIFAGFFLNMVCFHMVLEECYFKQVYIKVSTANTMTESKQYCGHPLLSLTIPAPLILTTFPFVNAFPPISHIINITNPIYS